MLYWLDLRLKLFTHILHNLAFLKNLQTTNTQKIRTRLNQISDRYFFTCFWSFSKHEYHTRGISYCRFSCSTFQQTKILIIMSRTLLVIFIISIIQDMEYFNKLPLMQNYYLWIKCLWDIISKAFKKCLSGIIFHLNFIFND